MTKPKRPTAMAAYAGDEVVTGLPPRPLPTADLEPEREWLVDDGAVRAGFGWHFPGMHPVHLASLGRLEAQERIAARAEAEARAERVEQRYTAGMMMAAADASMRGLPWSPTDPWRVWPTMEQRLAEASMVEAAQDAAYERRALVDAGLLHLLPADVHLLPSAARSASAADVPVPPGGRSRPASAATPLRSRIRAALRRIERGTASPPANQPEIRR